MYVPKAILVIIIHLYVLLHVPLKMDNTLIHPLIYVLICVPKIQISMDKTSIMITILVYPHVL